MTEPGGEQLGGRNLDFSISYVIDKLIEDPESEIALAELAAGSEELSEMLRVIVALRSIEVPAPDPAWQARTKHQLLNAPLLSPEKRKGLKFLPAMMLPPAHFLPRLPDFGIPSMVYRLALLLVAGGASVSSFAAGNSPGFAGWMPQSAQVPAALVAQEKVAAGAEAMAAVKRQGGEMTAAQAGQAASAVALASQAMESLPPADRSRFDVTLADINNIVLSFQGTVGALDSNSVEVAGQRVAVSNPAALKGLSPGEPVNVKVHITSRGQLAALSFQLLDKPAAPAIAADRTPPSASDRQSQPDLSSVTIPADIPSRSSVGGPSSPSAVASSASAHASVPTTTTNAALLPAAVPPGADGGTPVGTGQQAGDNSTTSDAADQTAFLLSSSLAGAINEGPGQTADSSTTPPTAAAADSSVDIQLANSVDTQTQPPKEGAQQSPAATPVTSTSQSVRVSTASSIRKATLFVISSRTSKSASSLPSTTQEPTASSAQTTVTPKQAGRSPEKPVHSADSTKHAAPEHPASPTTQTAVNVSTTSSTSASVGQSVSQNTVSTSTQVSSSVTATAGSNASSSASSPNPTSAQQHSSPSLPSAGQHPSSLRDQIQAEVEARLQSH